MIEKISLALIDESGNAVPIENIKNIHVDTKIERKIADTFAEIRHRINDFSDEEIKISERFNFALALHNYLKEMKQQYADD